MKILPILFLLFSSLTYSQTVSDVFKAMPSEFLPGLSEGNRTMLVVDTGLTTVPSPLGEIKKKVHTDNHLVIQTSEIGTMELKLLPVASDSVIVCLINTVCGDACDSRIEFYTSSWNKIADSALLPPISGEIFFDSSQNNRKNYKYAVSLPGIYPISATFDEGGTDLQLTFNYKEHLTLQQVEEIAPFIKNDTLVYTWNGARFETDDN